MLFDYYYANQCKAARALVHCQKYALKQMFNYCYYYNKELNSPKPTTTVAKFHRYKDKQTVIKIARMLKGHEYYISEDVGTCHTNKKDQLTALKTACERRDIAYIRFDKIIIIPTTTR